MSLQFILKQGKPAAFSLCDRNYITALNFSGFCRSSFSLSIDLLIANASALRRKKRTPWKKYQFILGEILIISYLMSVSFRSLFSRLIRIRVFIKKLQKKFYQKSMVKLRTIERRENLTRPYSKHYLRFATSHENCFRSFKYHRFFSLLSKWMFTRFQNLLAMIIGLGYLNPLFSKSTIYF